LIDGFDQNIELELFVELNGNTESQIFLLVYLDPLAKSHGFDWFFKGKFSLWNDFLEKRRGGKN
jgi:hypothetical protein